MTQHPYPDFAKLVLAERAPAEVADAVEEITRMIRAEGGYESTSK